MSKRETTVFTRFFRTFSVLPFDIFCGKSSRSIWKIGKKIGEKINEFDIMILGIMLHNGIDKIITRDRDFEKASKYLDIETIIIE